MNWLRDTLKKNRTFVLAFLLVETFYWADGLQFVYAHEIREQEREVHFQRLSELLGSPVEKLRGERWSLFGPLEELAEDVSSSVGVALDDLSSTLRRPTRRTKSEVSRLTSRLDDLLEAPPVTPQVTPVVSVEPAAILGAPQETEEPESARPRTIPRAAASPRERTGRASRSEPKALPLRKVETKARTEKAVGTTRSVHSSAVAPASTPRRVIPKDAVPPEIAALAESLGNAPADIFRFVHDKIDFDPKWGAAKSPLGTLYERQGTSWDQAWLLQQLLTAAGVDARLEWGEVEIPVEMLQNLTGVEDPWRAGDLMTTAGTPIVLLVEGSQVRTARMSHVWVKAHLDYIPNRGVTPGPGDTWIRMDPSLKRFAIAGDLRLDEAVPYDLGEYLQSGTELSPRQFYEAALDAYITANHPEVSSLEELKRTKRVVEEAFPFVPGTLRGKILSVQGESVEMPEAFQQKLKLEVREAGGPVLVTYETPWPAVYGQRLELAWTGATSSDQATLDLYGGIFSTPPFEVDLKPSIRVEGVEVAAGSAIGSAEDVVVQATWTTPQGLETVVPFEMWAGEPGVLSLDFGRTPQETIDRYTEELSASTDPAEQEAWSLALAGAHDQRSLGGDFAHLAELRWQRVLNLGRTVLAVQRGAVSVSSDGTPLTFSRGPAALDLGSMPLGLFPAEGGVVSTVSTLELLGSQGSFQEGEALGQVFEGDHVTGVTFLTRAVREGQTLTRLDAENLDEALAAVELSLEAEASVRAGVEDGWLAWIPESQLFVGTFDATGYVLEDPATGAAGYFVTYERLVQGLDANIVFHSPQDLDVVTAPTDVVATIESEALQSWTLAYQRVGEGPPVVLATGEGPLTQATLAPFDPTLLLNGLYHLVLTGRDIAGQSVSEMISVSVEGSLKLGNFTMSYVDLSIPLSGLDIEVVRTYDSRDKQPRDFGIGWTLDIRQGSYRNNRPPGEGWVLQEGFLPCQVPQETRSHLTTIQLSEREIYRFRLEVGNGSPSVGGCYAQVGFVYVDGPVPGTTLDIQGPTQVFWASGSDQLIDLDTLAAYEPENVRLTTRDGRRFDFNLEEGVMRIIDANDNEVAITPEGITHSSGQTVTFERDEEGRIERIVDPRSNDILYEYDIAGDLRSVTNQAGAQSRFAYDEDHRIVDIFDPHGVNVVRTDYDADGRLISLTDAFGKAILIAHDMEQNQQVITNRLGQVKVLRYDSRGNLLEAKDELGKSTAWTYDEKNRILTRTDPLGNTLTRTYDANGNRRSETDALGNVTLFDDYDSLGNVRKITDARGGVTTLTFDSRGNALSRTDPLGNTTRFSFDARGNLRTREDALGQVTTLDYDGFGNRTFERDPLGNESSSTYDAMGSLLTQTTTRTLPDGSTETLSTTLTVDELGRTRRTDLPNGRFIENAYDFLGAITATKDALGRVTTFEYDEAGRLTKTTYPDQTFEGRTYDAEGRLVVITDRGGRTTTMEYDALGRVTRKTFPDGTETELRYDDAGHLVASVDARGSTTSYAYDGAGRRISVTDALGNTTPLRYDAMGNLVEMEDPLHRISRFEYDGVGRLLKTTWPDGSTLRTEYDALGRSVREIDPAGVGVDFEYDSFGRLVKVTDALGASTTYGYDELGNMISQTDANQHTTRFEYGLGGLLAKRILPDGASESFTYDSAGRRLSRTDFNGVTIQYEYDTNDRLTRRSYPDGSATTMTYTPTGRLQTVSDARGVTSYSYDERDRLIRKTSPEGYELTYTWDAAGNRTSVQATLADGNSLETLYTYDELSRMKTVTDSRSGVYTYTYDAADQRASLTYPNGNVTSYTYDAIGRLEQLLTQTSTGEVIRSDHYQLSPAGDRQTVTEWDGIVRDYRYDSLYRLIDERVEDAAGALVYQSSFTYDPVGNRLGQVRTAAGGSTETISYTYDERDRLLTELSALRNLSYTWDANGSLLAKEGTAVDGATVDTTYTWDFEHRLVEMSSADGRVVTNEYDAEGAWTWERVTDQGQVADTGWIVDRARAFNQVMAEVTGDGELAAAFVRGAPTIGAGELLGLLPTGEDALAYHVDRLESVRALSRQDGSVESRYSYKAFGEWIDPGDVAAQKTPFFFAGEMLAAAGYNLRSRWMEPSVGRFLSMDSHAGFRRNPKSLNKYGYAESDPTSRVDPGGTFAVSIPLNISFAFFGIGIHGSPPVGQVGKQSVRLIACCNDWDQGHLREILDHVIDLQQFQLGGEDPGPLAISPYGANGCEGITDTGGSPTTQYKNFSPGVCVNACVRYHEQYHRDKCRKTPWSEVSPDGRLEEGVAYAREATCLQYAMELGFVDVVVDRLDEDNKILSWQ